ncbi:MAG: efflux RND transporter periplasmic adaptor subunit [Planctomycetes bacterium]|nr:efflux RND transporter periplasmic adaptor subunit [Planctomycetota bacterium]
MALKDKLVEIYGKIGTRPKIILLIIVLLVIGFKLGRVGRSVDRHADHTDQTNGSTETKPTLWTCSMHPEVKMEKPGLCPKCSMKLIPLVIDDSSGGSLRQLVVSEEAKKLMDIEVASVERKFVDAAIRMVGKIDFDETNLAYITAWVPGRLDKLYVDYTGVHVNKGDHMVYLYSPELISAQEELLGAIEAVKDMKDTELGVMQEMSKATVVAAREKLRLWGLKAKQIAEIEKTGKVTDHMTIYSPTGGIVIHKNAREGMYVQTGTKIYTIADLTKIWVVLDAYESDLQWLRYGQAVEFTTVSNPGETFKGTISFIDPILNEKTRTVKVRVNVANPEGKLKPGMFVKAVVHSTVAGSGKIMDVSLTGKWICPMHTEIIKDDPGKCDICEMPLVQTETLGYVSDDPATVEKPLVIPVTAALITGTRAIVYVQLPDTEKPTFEGREIVLGPRAGDYYLVRSGLKEGEHVVVKGSFKIDSSLQIMAKPSMMTPEGAGGGGMHDHGPKEEKKGEESGKIDNGLSALTNHQMQTVIAKAKEAAKAVKSQDISQVRTAFKQLEKALMDVDTEQLTSSMQMLWMEFQMRLGNDAIEGSEAQTLKDAEDAAKSLAENIKSFVTKFGLAHKDKHAASKRAKISDDFRSQLADVFESYFAMQKALAGDNADLAAKSAKDITSALKAVDMKLLTGSDHNVWMKNVSELKQPLSKSAETKDIDTLRKNFVPISQQVINIARHFGSVIGKPVFITHCSMAFDNTGADWLQASKDKLNPYFGAEMLKCGSVEDVVDVKNIWEKTDE